MSTGREPTSRLPLATTRAGRGSRRFNQPLDTLQRLDAFGADGRKVLQVHLSWAPTEEEARAVAHERLRSDMFAPPVCRDLDAFGEHVLPQLR